MRVFFERRQIHTPAASISLNYSSLAPGLSTMLTAGEGSAMVTGLVSVLGKLTSQESRISKSPCKGSVEGAGASR